MQHTPDSPGTVFVVDDDESVLRAMERLLRSAGLGVRTYSSPLTFLEQCDPGMAGCLLLDLSMPGLTGLDLQEALAARDIRIPVVFLSGHGDIPSSVRALKRGAVDFLTKPVDDATLLATLSDALERDRELRSSLADVAAIRNRIGALTPREREVMGHVIAGRLNKQIAAELGTVEKTVKVHRARMMRKMQVRSVAELVRLAGRADWTKV